MSHTNLNLRATTRQRGANSNNYLGWIAVVEKLSFEIEGGGEC
jgi:hypothetical protein